MLRIRHYKKLLLCIHITGIHCIMLIESNTSFRIRNRLTVKDQKAELLDQSSCYSDLPIRNETLMSTVPSSK